MRSTPSASRMSISSCDELVREALLEHLGHAARRRLGAEEARAHVVLEADDGVAALGEVDDGLGADQAAGAGDDRDGHTRRLTRMADARTKRLTLIACILGTAVVFLDGTVVNVALPAIRDDLDTRPRRAAVGRRGLPADARLAAARRRLARRPARPASGSSSVGLAGFGADVGAVRDRADRRAADRGAGAAGRSPARCSCPPRWPSSPPSSRTTSAAPRSGRGRRGPGSRS